MMMMLLTIPGWLLCKDPHILGIWVCTNRKVVFFLLKSEHCSYLLRYLYFGRFLLNLSLHVTTTTIAGQAVIIEN